MFVARLRTLSGGKPVGFKLCLGRKVEFMAIVKAMLETKVLPDFITIDGSEGGTGAAPVEFSNRLGTPCIEATYYINQVLVGAGLRDQIRLISAGQTASGFDMLEKIALGADSRECGAIDDDRSGLCPGKGLQYQRMPKRASPRRTLHGRGR